MTVKDVENKIKAIETLRDLLNNDKRIPDNQVSYLQDVLLDEIGRLKNLEVKNET